MGQEGPLELYLKQLVIDVCKHTLLLKGWVSLCGQGRGSHPTYSASQSLGELQGKGLLEPRVC